MRSDLSFEDESGSLYAAVVMSSRQFTQNEDSRTSTVDGGATQRPSFDP